MISTEIVVTFRKTPRYGWARNNPAWNVFGLACFQERSAHSVAVHLRRFVVQRLTLRLVVLPFLNVLLHRIIKRLHQSAQRLLACFRSITAEAERKNEFSVIGNCNLAG